MGPLDTSEACCLYAGIASRMRRYLRRCGNVGGAGAARADHRFVVGVRGAVKSWTADRIVEIGIQLAMRL
jgi:hypothetical protein